MWLRWLSATVALATSACSRGGEPAAESSERQAPHPLCERIPSVPRCAPPASEQCSDDAAADLNLAVDAGLEIARQPYDNAQCSGRFVYEVDTEGSASSLAEHHPERGLPLWLLSVWDITQIETPEACSEVGLDVAIRRELASSGWQDWAQFRVLGDWRHDVGACETVMCGQYPDGSVNDTKGARTRGSTSKALAVCASRSPRTTPPAIGTT